MKAIHLLLPALLCTLAGCGARRAKEPDWTASAPTGTVMAISGEAGWVIQQPRFQSGLRRFPLAEQTLDLFLKRARISPKGETGRISFYVLDLELKEVIQTHSPGTSNFLIQLGGFRDPKALMMAVAEAFPMEGSIQVGNREYPLHVLMDFNEFHVRLLFDEHGRLWMGDLKALAALGRPRPTALPSQRAAEWISGSAPIQGFLIPEAILKDASKDLPREFARELPQGIQALAWSVTPTTAKDAPHLFEMAIAGTPEGIQQVTPWISRLVALLSNLPGASTHPAEVLEERGRVGLRAQLSSTQLDAVMSRLSQSELFRVEAPGNGKP